MRVLVAGGSGWIGSALVARLVEDGHSVLILSRRPDAVQSRAGISVAGWDGHTPQGWEHLVEEADAIVNLVGENLGAGRWTARRMQRIVSSRLNAGKAIAAAVERASRRPHVLIQSSAIGYYGVLDDQILTESSPAGTDFLARLCVDWEASTQSVENLGVRRVVVRTGLVLSPTGGSLQRLLLPYRFFAGGPLGNGKQWWSWISMEDEVRALMFLLKNDAAYGAFNLTAPNPLRMKEFGKILAEVLHRPYWLPVPSFALRLFLGEMSMLVLKGQRVV
ncbi:MAG: TIGR01777 family oxidoreductase, partial [Anaerolineales bacterium]